MFQTNREIMPGKQAKILAADQIDNLGSRPCETVFYFPRTARSLA
jgi:hypothetical protein